MKKENMNIRLNAETKKQFLVKAKLIGNPSEVFRKIIEAFVEDRLVIKKPEKSELEGLYNG